jgi:hypothetical protein
MATLRIKTNNMFDTLITVRESDPYSKSVYLKLEADVEDAGMRSCTDHFMTSVQLIELGQFLITEAKRLEIAK